jgi:hypothetical protein
MSILKRASFWVTLLMLVLILIFVVSSFDFPKEKAKLFPLVVGIPGIVMGVVILLSERWPGLIKRFDVNIGMDNEIIKESVEAEAQVEGGPEITGAAQIKPVLACAGWMAGYAVVIFLIGFNVANFLMPTLYSRVHARASWWKALLIGVSTDVFIYVMFDYFMKVSLFEGILFGAYLPHL